MNIKRIEYNIVFGSIDIKSYLSCYYDFVASQKYASFDVKRDAILARNLLGGMPMEFIKNLSSEIGVSLMDLVRIFKNSSIVKFFSRIKWSFKKLYDLLKFGYSAYRDLQKAIAEYVSNTRVVKWTSEELEKLDKWLKKHPKVKRIAGIGVAALLIYIWFNMSFTGDYEFDFDMSDVLSALTGGYSLKELFASSEGVKMIIALAVGAGLKLSFPWPAPTSFHFVFSILNTLAKEVGVKLKLTKK